jgi:hypothetical protein
MEDPLLDALIAKKLIDAKSASIAQDLVSRGKTLEQALVGWKIRDGSGLRENQI